MSHHGMHIPPAMLGLLPGMTSLGKIEKTKKKQKLNKSASTGRLDDLNEIEENEDDEFAPARSGQRPAYESSGEKPGGRPRQQQLSDKVVKTLIEAQEETLPR